MKFVLKVLSSLGVIAKKNQVGSKFTTTPKIELILDRKGTYCPRRIKFGWPCYASLNNYVVLGNLWTL